MESEVSPSQIKKEKDKTKKLRQSQWWQKQLQLGKCNYCGEQFPKGFLTMDHVVPLARGGKSSKGNVVVCCKDCNSKKKYHTPAEMILQDQKPEKNIF